MKTEIIENYSQVNNLLKPSKFLSQINLNEYKTLTYKYKNPLS